MVKIRLRRTGATKRPYYRLVVADSRSPRDGKFIEAIGHLDPLANPAKLVVDADKVRQWMQRGARPTEVARALLAQEGILNKAVSTRRHPLKEVPVAAPVEDVAMQEPAEQESKEEVTPEQTDTPIEEVVASDEVEATTASSE